MFWLRQIQVFQIICAHGLQNLVIQLQTTTWTTWYLPEMTQFYGQKVTNPLTKNFYHKCPLRIWLVYFQFYETSWLWYFSYFLCGQYLIRTIQPKQMGGWPKTRLRTLISSEISIWCLKWCFGFVKFECFRLFVNMDFRIQWYGFRRQ